MNHYKSWSGLNKQLNESLCDSLKDRISYFLTRYHEVHDSYGRASIKLDGKELVVFSWIDMYRQESDADDRWKATGVYDSDAPEEQMGKGRHSFRMGFLTGSYGFHSNANR